MKIEATARDIAIDFILNKILFFVSTHEAYILIGGRKFVVGGVSALGEGRYGIDIELMTMDFSATINLHVGVQDLDTVGVFFPYVLSLPLHGRDTFMRTSG